MYRKLTVFIFAVAVLLRLLLCWGNPPSNSFDDHFEPIALILQTGHIPAKNACFQCYQPPVFYYSSAILAKPLIYLGYSDPGAIEKFLQFLNCFYGIATLAVIYLILKRLDLSEFSRLMAFCVICFLPRHIFMSAMHSNDCLAYLGISLSAYLLLVTMGRGLTWPFAALLGVSLALTIFVKYTALLVLPMAAAPLITLIGSKPAAAPRSKSVPALLLALAVPLLVLGIYMADNYRDYGQALPWNDAMVNTSAVQPHDPEGISFTSFTPWQFVSYPVIIPGQMHSFWTMIYAGMWIDNEPRFTDLTDKSPSWPGYFNWLTGKGAFPPALMPISNLTIIISAGLLICGLLPLWLIFAGCARCLRAVVSFTSESSVLYQAFPIILTLNAVGISLLAVKAPVYSSMKASYFLNSLPAFSVCIALGIQRYENIQWFRGAVKATCCCSAVLTTVYIVRIYLAVSAT